MLFIMIGMDVNTGKFLSSYEHLLQSVTDILTTPIGSRVMLRDYGSDIPKLLDSNMSPQTFALIYAATAEALDKWEPRLKLTRVQVLSVSFDGTCSLYLEGTYEGQQVQLDADILRLA
jgi:phage baseplate assembly protein W